MQKYKLLSYPLSEKTPMYGNNNHVKIKEDKQIKKADSCNTYLISMSNHSGTHIDAPKHFIDSGKCLFEYNINELIFNCPQIVDFPKKENELVLPEDLKGIKKKCDILLIRTGFYRFRGNKKYWTHNPGIAPETAEWLRKNKPYLRAVGIDTISVSPFQNRDAGRQAHQIFLNQKMFTGSPILLIEDMNLSDSLIGLAQVMVVPLFIEGIDSMACTVVGIWD